MIMITPDSPSRVITDFNPATDMVHLEAGVIAERLEFADYPDTIADVAAGLTIRVLTATGEIASETVLVGVSTASELVHEQFHGGGTIRSQRGGNAARHGGGDARHGRVRCHL